MDWNFVRELDISDEPMIDEAGRQDGKSIQCDWINQQLIFPLH
jgi:hypothetical protein